MKANTHNLLISLLVILLSASINGCATLDGPDNPDDPLEQFNRSMYAFNETFDKYAYKPVAQGYQAITPDAVDKGITNFFSNLDEVVVIINDVLQFKFKRTISDLSRFIVNSTIGVLGLFDAATELELPKHDEDFGQTLGVWGFDSGPYLVLPFLGPSSIRDGIGLSVDITQFDVIFDQLNDEEEIAAIAVKYTDKRADLLKAKKLLDEIAPDPYAFMRDAWVQRRENLVYDGAPPESTSDEELFEDDLFKDDIIRK